MKTARTFSAACTIALLSAAFAAPAPAQATVITNRGVMCNADSAGKSKCMQDVTILDDLSLALLAGATDEEATAMVSWIKTQDARVSPSVRGYNEITQFVSILAIGDPAPVGAVGRGPSFGQIPVAELIAGRRADIKAHKKFLLPLAQLVSPTVTQADMGNPATALVSFEPVTDDERASVGARSTNVCARKPGAAGFYCVKISNISEAMLANKPRHVAAGYFQNVPLARLPRLRPVRVVNRSTQKHEMRIQGADKLLYAVEIEVTGPAVTDAVGTSALSAIATKAVILSPRGVLLGHSLLTAAQ